MNDLISRQAVLNTLDRMDKALDTDRTVESYKELLTECYKVLPSVKQEPKMGHWITIEMTQDDGCRYTVTYCSECDEDVDYRTDYCPNCGCHMDDPQESEDKE